MRIKILLAIMGAILPIVFIIFGGFILSRVNHKIIILYQNKRNVMK
jgi:hypothetical protein